MGDTEKTNFLCTISYNIEVYEEPVLRTKKIPHSAAKFEAGEEIELNTKVCAGFKSLQSCLTGSR